MTSRRSLRGFERILLALVLVLVALNAVDQHLALFDAYRNLDLLQVQSFGIGTFDAIFIEYPRDSLHRPIEALIEVLACFVASTATDITVEALCPDSHVVGVRICARTKPAGQLDAARNQPERRDRGFK